MSSFETFEPKKQFQYKFLVKNWTNGDTFDQLNKFGEDGWEIISIVKTNDSSNADFYVTLKREY